MKQRPDKYVRRMTALNDEAKETLRLVREIRPMLAGKPAHVQGAVLADLLAMWLAGHVVAGNERETERWRENVLQTHIKGMRKLIEPNYKMVIEPQLKRMTH